MARRLQDRARRSYRSKLSNSGNDRHLGCWDRRDRGSGGRRNDGGSSRDQVLQRVNVDGGVDRVVDRPVHGSKEVHPFRRIDRYRVRDVDHILVAHLKSCCEEIARRITQVEVVDDGNDGAFKFRNVDA